MPQDWFAVDSNLAEKPEVQAIIDQTDLEAATVCGRMIMFWGKVDQHGIRLEETRDEFFDGFIPGYTIKTLCRLCGGDEQFWQAVEQQTWLRCYSDGVALPGFDRRFSDSSKMRIGDARRKSVARAKAKDEQTPKTTALTAAPDICPQTTGQKPDYRTGQRQDRTETGQRQEKTKPSPSSPSATTVDDDDGIDLISNRQLVDRISTAGVVKSKSTVSTAQQRGLDNAHILAVVEHFESNPGAWQPGCLRWRLIDQEVASKPAAEGWPAMNSSSQAKASANQQAETNRQRLDAERSDSEKRIANRAARIAANEDLLRKFGPDIDALNADAQRELLTSDIDRAILSRSSNWRESSVKERLLRSYASRMP